MSVDTPDQNARPPRWSAPGIGFVVASVVATWAYFGLFRTNGCSGELCWVQTLFGLMFTGGAWLVAFLVASGVVALYNRTNKAATGVPDAQAPFTCVAEVGTQLDRTTIGDHGFADSPKLLERIATILMRFREVRREPERALETD